MAVRAVRGATQLDEDTREHMLDRVAELVTDVMAVSYTHLTLPTICSV